MKHTATVDIGTTSIKLGLYDGHGVRMLVAKRPTPVTTDAWGEIYDVDALLAMIEEFITDIDVDERSRIECIAITGVGESGGLVDEELGLRSPMILWHDQRGAPAIERLTDEERCSIYRRTGLPANANYAASKVAWAVSHAPARPPGTMWLNLSEFVAAHLSGSRWAEPSLASRTLALDVTRGTWSPEACRVFGLPPDIFPPLRAGVEGTMIRSDVAGRLGVPTDVWVHVAGHDHMIGAIGADLRPGEILNSTGTTEGLLTLNETPRLDEEAAEAKLANGIACDGQTSTLFVSIPTGGAIFDTLQGMLGMSATDLTARADRLAHRYVAGDIDLAQMPVVVPHFRGSPPPEKNSGARAIIGNLGAGVRADDLVFGAFLGMAWQFRKALELLDAAPSVVKVIGPASRNPLWLHLKADALGADLSVSREPEVVSRGAQALTSGEHCTWNAYEPFAVVSDPARHARILQWHEASLALLRRAGEVTW